MQAGGPKREILYLLSKLGSDHRQWVETACAAVLSTRGTETLTSYAAEQARLAREAQRVDQAASYQQWLSGALVEGMGPVYRALKSHEQTLARPFRGQSALARAYCRLEFWGRIWDASIVPPTAGLSVERLALRAEASQQAQDILEREGQGCPCCRNGRGYKSFDGNNTLTCADRYRRTVRHNPG